MNATTPETAAGAPPVRLSSSSQRPRRRRSTVLALILVTIVTAGVVLGVTGAFGTGGARASTTGVVDNADPTSLATVARQDLSSQTSVNATLGYAGSYSAVNQAQGTITAVPAVGQVVSQGQVLYQVNGSPVVLLYGTTPAYRSLSEGADASDVTGLDVAELNADLVALGYATSAEIPIGSDQFTSWTKDAVERWQKALGVPQNGTLALGQAVFLPSAIRVTSIAATLGAPAQTGQAVLSGTSTTRQVTIDLDAAQQSEVAVGDKVVVTLPDGQNTPGVVSSVGTVASTPSSGGGSPTITVEVTPTDPAATGHLDQAPLQVLITTATARDALVVPVNALLALSGGGYAVEVANTDGVHHLVDVSIGLFDDADGLVQVTGSGLSAGQHVVVPAL
jgi:hypothetical protein